MGINSSTLLILVFALVVINFVLFIILFLELRKVKKLLRNSNWKDLKNLSESLDILNSKTKKSLRKVGLVKFNPFNDVGGSLSFSLAFLDEDNNGIVISSLHNRNSTRIYAKPVCSGKEGDVELSSEEKEAVFKAMNK